VCIVIINDSLHDKEFGTIGMNSADCNDRLTIGGILTIGWIEIKPI